MRVWLGTIRVRETRHSSIIIEFDPLSQAGEPVAAWDAEVGNTSIVEDIALRSSLEGLLVLEDAVLKTFDLFVEAMELHRSVGFAVGDCGKESICNGAKERRIDVIVRCKGRLNRPRRHCWWGQSCWM